MSVDYHAWYANASSELERVIKERLERNKAVKTSIGYLVPPDGERYERIDGQQVGRRLLRAGNASHLQRSGLR